MQQKVIFGFATALLCLLAFSQLRDWKRVLVPTKKGCGESLLWAAGLCAVCIPCILTRAAPPMAVLCVAALCYWIPAFFRQGAAKNGMQYLSRYGGFCPWERLDRVEISETPRGVRARFSPRGSTEAFTQTYSVKGWETLFRFLSENAVPVTAEEKRKTP